MAARRTWIWIIVACLGVIVLGLFAIAGVGIYFVASHIDTDRVSAPEAMRQFDEARAVFKDQKPLFELDKEERPRPTRPLQDLPRSSVRPQLLTVMAWDADDERIVRISVPFWLLRMGGRQIDINDGNGFDLNDLHLDVRDLERIGPILVFDYRSASGERVLVWTK